MDLEQIQVTVGMPVFNGAAFLNDAVANIARQTHKNILVIISDNCSTDETAEIAIEWTRRDNRIKYVRHVQNMGVLRNFQFAAHYFPTEYTMIASCDDGWSNDYISDLLNPLHTNRGQLAISTCTRMSKDWEPLYTVELPDLSFDKTDSTEALMKAASSGWFAGLWRTSSLRLGIDEVVCMDKTWGCEYVAMLPAFLVRGVVRGRNAIYYQRLTGSSAELYQPKTVGGQRDLYWSFVKACNAVASQLNQPLQEGVFRRYAANRVGGRQRILKLVKRRLLRGIYY